MLKQIVHWIDRNILELRLSFLPPLMVYMAYGISGLTSIVGVFSSRNTWIYPPNSWPH